MSRCGIVILSGGLGPTEDDVTREAVAQALGRGLTFHSDIAEALELRFAAMNARCGDQQAPGVRHRRRRSAAQRSRHRAGQWVTANGSVAVLLPGPPHELKAMFQQQCLPRLVPVVPRQAIRKPSCASPAWRSRTSTR